VDGKAVLRWILHKQGVKAWAGFVWPKLETSVEFINHGYVPAVFKKFREFLGQVSDCFRISNLQIKHF
jgi:hypothetical protein